MKNITSVRLKDEEDDKCRRQAVTYNKPANEESFSNLAIVP